MADFPLVYLPFTLDEEVIAGLPRIEGALFTTNETAAVVNEIPVSARRTEFPRYNKESQAIEGLLDTATQATRGSIPAPASFHR